VGEAIYAALSWLADAIAEYGSIILGILASAIIIVLFIGCVYATLRLWGIFLRMSRGDVEGASAEAREVVGAASGIVGRLR
jgi:hypothetical protein